MTASALPTGAAPERAVLHQRPRPAVGVALVAAGCAALLAVAWWRRHETDRVAFEGLGYALGLVGLGMMVLLLGYSLRKHWRPLRHVGPIRRWFHVHMMLGILGPTAILLHANFETGSLNARVALWSMLIVASSGFVGRFIYTRIHYELFGRRASLAELRRDAAGLRSALGTSSCGRPEVVAILDRFESWALRPPRGPLDALARVLVLGVRTRHARRALRRAVAAERDPAVRRTLQRGLAPYLDATRRVAAFAFYERAFALWHALHLPLCVLLFGAAAVHVVAVHVY